MTADDAWNQQSESEIIIDKIIYNPRKKVKIRSGNKRVSLSSAYSHEVIARMWFIDSFNSIEAYIIDNYLSGSVNHYYRNKPLIEQSDRVINELARLRNEISEVVGDMKSGVIYLVYNENKNCSFYSSTLPS